MTGEVGEKPAMVKTHLRDVVVVPEMVGSIIGIYNGKGKCFNLILDLDSAPCGITIVKTHPNL